MLTVSVSPWASDREIRAEGIGLQRLRKELPLFKISLLASRLGN